MYEINDGTVICSDCLIDYLEEEGIIGKVKDEEEDNG